MICVKTSLHMPQTDFGCTYSWATKLNTRRKIPYLRTPFIILYLSYKLRYYTRITSLRKAVTAHVKNVVVFHVCLISPISCWHVTRLSRHLVRLINERKSLHHSQSKVFCRNFFGLWLLNTKKSVSFTNSDVQSFLEGEENQNTERKTESYVFSGFSRLKTKIKNWKICHKPILAVYLKDFFYR